MRYVFCACFAVVASFAIAEIPAFPGAEGYGAHSNGGRGGDVYIVSNLQKSGPGSFAEAISTVPSIGRTIVFAVSGHIPINKPKLKASKVTIAGQTAPGDGISLKGSCFWISGSDVVVRFLRFRHGRHGNGGDALESDRGARNLIIDHCDVMFSTDENFSMFGSAPPTLTFQWSTNAWGLQTHSAGGLWLVDHATAHHNLWAHNHTRNPKLIKPQAFDWINNVNFGWDIGFNLAGADVPGTYRVNIRGSSFIPAGKAQAAVFGGGKSPDGSMPFHVFLDDCAPPGKESSILSGLELHRESKPWPQESGAPVAIDDRLTAYKKVLSQAGALRMEIDPEKPLRDEVTSLLISDVVAGRRRMIADEKELGLSEGGMGALRSTPAPADADRDGMPNDYEIALGWKPTVQDHNYPLAASRGVITGTTFFPPDTPAGYTRLEEYLHFCSIPHAMITGPSKVDLRKFTSGFTASPTFTVANLFGGTVTAEGPGNCLVTFTPKPAYVGRARFDFTVTDRENSTWTQTCAFVVTRRK